MVATDVLPLVQEPPEKAWLKVTGVPEQTIADPTIGGATAVIFLTLLP